MKRNRRKDKKVSIELLAFETAWRANRTSFRTPKSFAVALFCGFSPLPNPPNSSNPPNPRVRFDSQRKKRREAFALLAAHRTYAIIAIRCVGCKESSSLGCMHVVTVDLLGRSDGVFLRIGFSALVEQQTRVGREAEQEREQEPVTGTPTHERRKRKTRPLGELAPAEGLRRGDVAATIVESRLSAAAEPFRAVGSPRRGRGRQRLTLWAVPSHVARRTSHVACRMSLGALRRASGAATCASTASLSLTARGLGSRAPSARRPSAGPVH